MYIFQSQVLISEAGGDQKIDKSSKAGGKTSSSFKNNKAKDAMESHVEMDSRLLSVLLTVSMNISCFCLKSFCMQAILAMLKNDVGLFIVTDKINVPRFQASRSVFSFLYQANKGSNRLFSPKKKKNLQKTLNL